MCEIFTNYVVILLNVANNYYLTVFDNIELLYLKKKE